MATKPDDEDILDLTPDMKAGPDDEDHGGDDAPGGDNPDDEGGEEQTVVSFADEESGGEDEADQGNAVIRRMREQLKESKKRIAELERSAPAVKKVEIGEKPTLAALNYDEEAYETALDEWRERKAAADRENASAEEQSRRANETWQADLGAYEAKKAKLGVDDFEEAEDVIKSSLTLVQQAVIVKAADDPAAFVYALSRSGTKMAELAKIDDPIKLAAAIARMEGAVKVTKKRRGPAIDRPLNGSSRPPVSGDKAKQLEKLEAAAQKSGDRTELIKFRRENGL